MSSQRTIQLVVTADDKQTMTLTGRLDDPFHDITVVVVLRKEGLRIISAAGRMDRIPYAAGCPSSLSKLEGAGGLELREGLSRKLRAALGGETGCPYLAELTEQLCRFGLVIIKSDEARQAMVAGDDADRFRLLRQEMGTCAGHTLAREDELPQWLEEERTRNRRRD